MTIVVVKFVDDGKGKYQSHEVIGIKDSLEHSNDGFINSSIHLTAYGASREESIQAALRIASNAGIELVDENGVILDSDYLS